ncbi:Os09g0475500 [Oryza sativa Japonica Group]|uniref:O-fucosyltransferase family protein n=2 Tax=Oryza sativa subsp. japonica TaxID=39947 RepID=C7J6Q8_ORYSJ|nr:hypothetical protein EE612_048498 [Oryza sativa]BAH94613.1 Os09g0475500 [Oryza sativa Japonica Group]BAT08600.1 Os09g0475500 [Oryza sativa Japonica Group]|eukprot:NP_001175885.1 Os09g0475500 [Oryza sativa Japonica Group]
MRRGGVKAAAAAEKAREAARAKVWAARASTTVVLWLCCALLLATSRELGRWSGCLTQPLIVVERRFEAVAAAGSERAAASASAAAAARGERAESSASEAAVAALPPKRIYKNNGYLMVSCNGGLNQMRAAICDMVTIARYLNVTLIVPELDKTSFWADPSEFKDIFDVDYFISSLRDEVRILKELPPRLKRRVELGYVRSMPPVSWSDISYYQNQVW